MIAYKFLRRDGTAAFTGFRWPMPDDGPGPWIEARPDPCRAGVHACRTVDLPYWANKSLFEIELGGEIVVHGHKVVAERGRLLRRIDAWNDDFRATYTRMCADRALELATGAGLEEWATVVEPSVPQGPASLSFIAARIAEEIDGRPGYHAERAVHSRWLAERLALS